MRLIFQDHLEGKWKILARKHFLKVFKGGLLSNSVSKQQPNKMKWEDTIYIKSQSLIKYSFIYKTENVSLKNAALFCWLSTICFRFPWICISHIQAFFIRNTFISNARLKMAKNWAKAKQHPEAELSPFENYSLSSSTLSTKTNKRYSKKCTKNKCVWDSDTGVFLWILRNF